MDTQLQRAKSIFERAIEFDAEARAGYVEGACADDAALRERVEGLLGEHDKQGDFLASRGVDQADNRRRPIPETVSHYRVFEKLGEGGMGEVWKAEDLNLKRTVALKFLPREVLGEEEIKARLIREAQAAASLDHPNVCAVYGIHEDDGRTFIAMACIDGPSLAEKIKERPLPLEEALEIAIQIAEGLQEAHERSVVHRDIKPSNVMLARRGRVKIMDFGLAAVADKTRLTKSGTTLGTPAYMSPEQAQGQAVDHRTDIWALGVVLYEMLTAKHPFPGEYEQAVVYSIINEAPEPVTAQRRGIPPKVDDLLNKALAKAPAARYQHADELIVDLRALSNNLAAATSSLDSHQVKTAPIPSGKVVSKRKLQLHQILLAATVLFALALSFLYLRQSSPQAPLRRFAISPPAALGFGASVSADGKQVALTTAGAEGELWVQDLNKQEPRMIEGTRGAGLTPSAPFWSPDSDFVGFSLGGQLMKVSAQGGLVIRLCELPGLLGGATWSPDGESIVFSSRDPYALYEVPSAGGVAKRIISPEERSSGGPWGVIVRPHFLPAEAGARVLVFSFGSPRENTMMALDLETGRREIVGSGNFPFYSSSGHLLFQPDYVTDEIWVLPFSLKTLKATGDAFPISDTGRRPTVAADQTLTFVDRAADQRQLAWFDRDGMSTAFITQFPGEGAGTRNPALSPDGRLVAFSANQNSNLDIWIWDIMRGVKSRMTTDPADDFAPRWRLVQYKMSLKGRAIPIQDEPDGDPLGGQEQSSCGRWESPCSKPNR